jgi:hypothetical protein
MYPAILSGAFSQRRKLRLCKEHFVAFLDQLDLHALDADKPANALLEQFCYLCGQIASGARSMLYVTCYDHDAARQDWYAPLHDNCVPGAVADWLIDTAPAS